MQRVIGFELQPFKDNVNRRPTERQCDQMARSFFNIWPFIIRKICPIAFKLAKVGSKNCQRPNKPSKNCQRRNFCCRSGEILPNLVSLLEGSINRKRIKQSITQKYFDDKKSPFTVVSYVLA